MMLEKDNSSSCDGCRKWTYRCTSVALGAVIIGLSLPALSAGSSPEGLNFGKGMLQNGAFSTGGSTKDCTVDYNFGLVNFKATNFCTGKEVDATYYSDDCSSVFPGSDLCKTCEHAGNAVVTLGTFGLIASFLAFGAIVAKYFFGKEEEKTWKLTAFISVAVCSIFTLICWTVWLDPCSYEIVDFLNAAPEGFDKADFNLGDAWGLYFFAWVLSFFGFAGWAVQKVIIYRHILNYLSIYTDFLSTSLGYGRSPCILEQQQQNSRRRCGRSEG